MKPCQHHDFLADVQVNRLEDSGRFNADVRIKCSQCGQPFRFVGLPMGVDLNGAAVSVDGQEARLAIHPAGIPLPVDDQQPPGFRILNSSPRKIPEESWPPTRLDD